MHIDHLAYHRYKRVRMCTPKHVSMLGKDLAYLRNGSSAPATAAAASPGVAQPEAQTESINVEV